MKKLIALFIFAVLFTNFHPTTAHAKKDGAPAGWSKGEKKAGTENPLLL